MTPEKLVDLLGDPKVSAKLADLLDDPRLTERIADLLNEPVVAHKLGALLQRPEVRGAVEGYLDWAVTGVVVLAVLLALNLLAALFNAAQLRRLTRNMER